MPYLQNDIYLTSGCSPIPTHLWPSSVYKFDNGGFYNWEQDNLPLYDLEERTDYLHKALLGAREVGSYGLIVSAAPYTGVANTSGTRYFGTVQAAIDLLPKRIDNNVIIEVTTSGNLGILNLSNIEFGPSGGLEIINRGFAKIFQSSSVSEPTISLTSGLDGTGGLADTKFTSLDLVNTLDLNKTICTAALIGRNIWSGCNRTLLLRPEFSIKAGNDYGTIGNITFNREDSGSKFIDNIASNQFLMGGALGHPVSGGAAAPVNWSWPALGPYDLTTLDGGRTVGRRAQTALDGVIGLTYANYFSEINIEQCNGPIYIRGFTVDKYNTSGAGVNINDINSCITINNSNGIVLENCSVTRSNKYGIKILNSDVLLNRGFIAYGNYQVTYSSPVFTRAVGTAAGLYAENSTIKFGVESVATKGIPGDCPFVFSNNDIGMHLVNSKLTTDYCSRGVDKTGATQTGDPNRFILVTQLIRNANSGAVLEHSTLDLDGKLSVFENLEGITSFHSKIDLSELSVDHNYWIGINLYDSRLYVNKHVENLVLDASSISWKAQVNIEENWQNVYLNSSRFISAYTGDLNNHSGMFRIFRSNGYYENLPIPSVHMENGSLFSVNKLQMATFGYLSGAYITVIPNHDTASGVNFGFSGIDGPVLGAFFSLNSGSTLDLHGVGSGRINMVGPATVKKQRRTTGIHADGGSMVRLAGPITISQVGVGVMLDNGSELEIGPHKYEGYIDNIGYASSGTASGTQTDIEIHSNRSGIVADHNSKVSIVDVGDYHNSWASVSTSIFYASANYNSANHLGLSAITDNASVRFYANTPAASAEFCVSADAYNYISSGITYGGTGKYSLHNDTWGTGTTETNYAKYSRGGFCVRALNGSNVEVKNVNFKAGHGQVSAAILDGDASEKCGKIYAWGISPDSTLRAEYCSVSSIYPSGAAYIGPPALYESTCTSALSGAPSSTPNTSSLSVLDSFGINPSAATMSWAGPATSLNKGPFRLFFTPNDPVNFVGYAVANGGAIGPMTATGTITPSGVIYGEPYQLIAQGYNPAIVLSSSYHNDSILSAIYPNEFSGMTGGSGVFFYTKDYLSPSYENNIHLDDSALNTFANAKNAITGKSNRAKLVSYIRNTTEEVGSGGSPPGGTGSQYLVGFDISKEI